MTKITLEDYRHYLFTGSNEDLIRLVSSLRHLVCLESIGDKLSATHLIPVSITDIPPDDLIDNNSLAAHQARLKEAERDSTAWYERYCRMEKERDEAKAKLLALEAAQEGIANDPLLP